MAWWLAYEELYGNMDEEYPIMTNKKKDVITLGGSDEGTVTFTVPEGSPAAADTISFDNSWWDYDGFSVTGNPNASPDTLVFTGSHVKGGMGNDHISFSGVAGTQWDSPKYYATDFGDDPYPTLGSADDDVYKFHYPPTPSFKHAKPVPDLTSEQTKKYGEDDGIRDLKDYVASTYKGHYTSQNNNVQTLDLIQSVGDAESFCRSNAIKYLSRYDKKGQAKRDILKAMHYCLLLYYFSGQTNETPTHGYETF